MNESNKIKCVILDDEQSAIEVLKERIVKHANLVIVLATTNPFDVQALMTREKVDLLFLDVHMPKVDGITFKSTISPDIDVIYCSADDTMGSAMFEIDAVDYLTKPISQSRFDRAMERYDRKRNPYNVAVNCDDIDDKISLQIRKGTYETVYEADIDYVLSTKGEVKVYDGERTIPSTKPIIWFLDKLSPNRFIQISQSAIVARNRIRGIQGNQLQLRCAHEPLIVSKTYKAAVLDYLLGKSK